MSNTRTLVVIRRFVEPQPAHAAFRSRWNVLVCFWAWWDWELTTLLQCFDTAGWVIRPVKHRLRNDLNCVERDVKLNSELNRHNVTLLGDIKRCWRRWMKWLRLYVRSLL